MKKAAIIVAGGSGTRMGKCIPKQFLCLNGKAILMHTMCAFYAFDKDIQLIVVLPESQIEYWKELCAQYHFTLPHQIIIGGETRFDSVKNGLNSVTNECLIAVHDGVRPLASKETIERCFKAAAIHFAVVPAIDLIDSIRKVSPNSNKAVDRSNYKAIQTPQVFESTLLKTAYEKPYQESFTDDASVVEASNIPIYLVEGNRENIKITTEMDLAIAELFLTNNQ